MLREDQGFGGRSSHLWFPSDQEEEGRLGVERIKRFKGKKLNPNPLSLVFGLGKTPNVDKGVLYLL